MLETHPSAFRRCPGDVPPGPRPHESRGVPVGRASLERSRIVARPTRTPLESSSSAPRMPTP